MNVIKFNNERIKDLNNSTNLRNDMSKSMYILKSKLELWNTNLMMAKGDIKKTKKEDTNKDSEDNEDKANDIGISFFNILINLKEEKKPTKKEEEKEKGEGKKGGRRERKRKRRKGKRRERKRKRKKEIK